MTFMKTALIVLVFCCIVSSKRYCQQDSDCDVIGDLTCQKSLCDSWGICGCPRGQASRFVGSSLKFQCVTLKKIGESCSTDGTTGLCGPVGSQCLDGTCECTGTEVPIWDGERCSPSNLGSSNTHSETCSDSLGNCGLNTDDPSTCTKSSGTWWGPNLSPFDGVPNTCACGKGTHTKIPNDYYTSPFVGRREPVCANILVGDKCLRDDDCENIGGTAICNDDFECECGAGLSPHNGGQDCAANVLVKGAKCWENNIVVGSGICGMNMVCGDVCKIKDYLDTNKPRTCMCAPGFNENGNQCVAISSGSSCTGDAMCKGIGYDALCLDGVCRAGASLASISSSIMLLAFCALQILTSVFML